MTVSNSPLAPLALLVALGAVALAAWALMSQPESTPAATDGSALPGDPKTRVCDAAHTVAMAVQLQTNTDIGPEPAAIEAVAGNARLAMLGGGEYLLGQIDGETPTDIAEAARAFGTTLRQIGINALAGVPNADEVQAGRIQSAEANRNELGKLCTR